MSIACQLPARGGRATIFSSALLAKELGRCVQGAAVSREPMWDTALLCCMLCLTAHFGLRLPPGTGLAVRVHARRDGYSCAVISRCATLKALRFCTHRPFEPGVIGLLEGRPQVWTNSRECFQKGIKVAKKLSIDEQDRIRLHRRVARPMPLLRHCKSMEGQTYFDFGVAMTAGGESVGHGDTGRAAAPSSNRV